jgi:hypothetical protein
MEISYTNTYSSNITNPTNPRSKRRKWHGKDNKKNKSENFDDFLKELYSQQTQNNIEEENDNKSDLTIHTKQPLTDFSQELHNSKTILDESIINKFQEQNNNLVKKNKNRNRNKNKNKNKNKYLLCEARIKTFNTWPNLSHIKSTDLARAGFIYTGRSDIVKCFSCGMEFMQWDCDDIPMKEHYRMSPNCKYVKETYCSDEHLSQYNDAQTTKIAIVAVKELLGLVVDKLFSPIENENENQSILSETQSDTKSLNSEKSSNSST